MIADRVEGGIAHLVQHEFQPMLGAGAFAAVGGMVGAGGTSFEGGWQGYVSKDLRRLFGSERAPYSVAYCGNVPGHKLSKRKLRGRCRAALDASLKAALSVTPSQLYRSTCPSDPEPACADRNRWTNASAIRLPAFPYQNRPTFQQVVTLTQQLAR